MTFALSCRGHSVSQTHLCINKNLINVWRVVFSWFACIRFIAVNIRIMLWARLPYFVYKKLEKNNCTIMWCFSYCLLSIIFLIVLLKSWERGISAATDLLPVICSQCIWRPRSGVEVAGWTVDRTILVRFLAYPHCVWALWWQGGKRCLQTSRCLCRGRLGTLKTPSCQWWWVPGSRSKFGN